jgi:hypothetical protein
MRFLNIRVLYKIKFMKKLFIVSCFFLALSAQSQTAFFRDVPAFFNPAAAGFEESFQATIFDHFSGITEPGYTGNTLNGALSKRLNRINSGIGINFSNTTSRLNDYYRLRFSSVGLNYNYQWKLKKESNAISLGISPTIGNQRYEQTQYDSLGMINPSLPPEILSRSQIGFAFGAAYKTKNLFLAASISPNSIPLNGSDNVPNSFGYAFLGSYAFRLSKFDLIPSALLTVSNGLAYTLLNARVQHAKLWWQFGVSGIRYSEIFGLEGSFATAVGYRFTDKINAGVSVRKNTSAFDFPANFILGALLSFELD